MTRRGLRSGVQVAALYTALAAGLLAPLAASHVLPDVYDLPIHVGTIVQARAALEEGQFPIRVAPREHAGWRYPLFQFYSPLPYAFAGALHKVVFPANPYLAYKATLLLFLALGGLFLHKLALWLVGSRPAAILGGALYMAAPYSLINVHARGAFTETVAQGLLAVAAYYSCRCYASPRFRFLILAALSWWALALTHLITFAYSAVFLGTLFLLLSIRGRRGRRRLARVAVAGAWGTVLAAHFLVPVALTPYIRLRHPGYLVNPYTRSWLTPLPGLLSPTSVAPEPLPGRDYGTPFLHPAVGWPMLLAAGTVFHQLMGGRLRGRRRRGDGFARPLLALFALALFTTWSPLDFWSLVPRLLHLAQFSYRFLTHVMWTGALLGALALVWLFGRLDGRHTVVGLLLIGLASGPYLPSARRGRTVERVLARPESGTVVYLPRPGAFEHQESSLPVRTAAETQAACRQLGPATSCLVTVPVRTLVELPVLFYPRLIDVRVDGHPAGYRPMPRGDYLVVAVEVEAGSHEVRAAFSGLPWGNRVSGMAWILTLGVLAAVAWRRWRERRRSH